MDLLLDWLYWEPVGHMVEALKVSRGLASENPGLRIAILLNSRAPLALAEGCSWVDSAFDADGRAVLTTRVGYMDDCFDIDLWRQLALVEACDILVSPHSGFALLAPCVGTPWLAISGGGLARVRVPGRAFLVRSA